MPFGHRIPCFARLMLWNLLELKVLSEAPLQPLSQKRDKQSKNFVPYVLLSKNHSEGELYTLYFYLFVLVF